MYHSSPTDLHTRERHSDTRADRDQPKLYVFYPLKLEGTDIQDTIVASTEQQKLRPVMT